MFAMDEAEVGVNWPPMHPNCGCGVEVSTKTKEEAVSDKFQYDWSKPGLPSTEFVTPEFEEKVIEVAKKLQIAPDDLMAVMAFESWFDPAAVNTLSSATGLIQFSDIGIDGWNVTLSDIGEMPAIQQMDYVYKFLSPYIGKMKTLSDIYMAVLYPIAVGESDDFVLFVSGTKRYDQNSGLDVDGDLKITKGEAVKMVTDRRNLFGLRQK